MRSIQIAIEVAIRRTKVPKLYVNLPSMSEYRLFDISKRTLSFSQKIFGVGLPVERHCITAVCPISTTRVCGLCVMIGKPGGVLSAARKKRKEIDEYNVRMAKL